MSLRKFKINVRTLGYFLLVVFLLSNFLLVFSTKGEGEDFTITCDRETYHCLQECEAICNVTNNLAQAVKVNVSLMFENLNIEPKEIYEQKNSTYNQIIFEYGNVTNYKECISLEEINSTTINCTTEINSTLANRNEEAEQPLCWDNCFDDFNTTHYWVNRWETIGNYTEENWKLEWKKLNKWLVLTPNKEIKTELNLSETPSTKTVKIEFKVPINSIGKFNFQLFNPSL